LNHARLRVPIVSVEVDAMILPSIALMNPCAPSHHTARALTLLPGDRVNLDRFLLSLVDPGQLTEAR
jgi:hypothetical protein